MKKKNLRKKNYMLFKDFFFNVLVVSTPDATTASKGKIQLAGDLSGTATAPTVPALATKENAANKSTVICQARVCSV